MTLYPQIGSSVGKLRNFIIEPFIPHKPEEESYVCIYSHRNGDTILFYHLGGVDIGNVDAKAFKLDIPIDGQANVNQVKETLLLNIDSEKKDFVANFIIDLYNIYVDLYFTYLEINPLGKFEIYNLH